MSRAASNQALLQAAVLGGDMEQLTAVLAHDAASSHERLAIYREHVIESLTLALGEVYPVTRRLVGDGFFRQLARHHIDRSPPRDPRLSHYGDGLAASIGALPVCAGLPYLVDIARLEWALHEAQQAYECMAPAEPSLSWAASRSATALSIDAQLPLVPSLRLLQSDWPIDDIWRSHQNDDVFGPLAIEASPRLFEVACDGGGPYVRALSPGQHALRTGLLDGCRIEEAAAAALAAEPTMDLARAFADLLSTVAVGGAHRSGA